MIYIEPIDKVTPAYMEQQHQQKQNEKTSQHQKLQAQDQTK